MPLTNEQRERLDWLLEGHLDEELEDREYSAKRAGLLAAFETSEELFLFAYHSSGDLMPREWRWVIDNPLCDAGTALLVFWRLSPGYLYQYTTAAEVPYAGDAFDLARDIERRYLAGAFPDRGLSFDPTDFRGSNLLEDVEEDGGADRIPAELKRPSPGRLVAPLW